MFTKPVLELKEAEIVVDAIIEEASKNPSRPMAIAVVDDTGEIICAKKMDGARSLNNFMALRKARASAETRADTTAIRELLGKDGFNTSDFTPNQTPVPGGIALVNLGGENAMPPIVYGAVGTSGRKPEDDEALAIVGKEALLKALGRK